MKHSSHHILVTLGATIEPIDSVRYLSNWSSGTLGCAIALAAATAGHKVTALCGEHAMRPQHHPRISTITFGSTRDLAAKCREYWPSHDVLIMAAAVSDFTPVGGQHDGKIRRGDSYALELTATNDVVADLTASKRNDQTVIAFSLAEQSKLEEVAREKLERKGVDAIIANPLNTMNSNEINAFMLTKDGVTFRPEDSLTKASFARWLISTLPEIHHRTPQNS